MTTLTKVPISLPHNTPPTKTHIHAIVAIFLPSEWPSAPHSSLTMTYTKSHANDHITLARPHPHTPPTEPTKLFLKLHKPSTAAIQLFATLVPTKQAEATICHAFAQTGLGARVYGFFETQDGTRGRVDEFLDARCLAPGDVEDVRIRVDVARGLATFCAMDAGLEKGGLEAYYDALTAGLAKYHRSEKLKALGAAGGVIVDGLVEYDFGVRVRRVRERLEGMGAKTGWCIHDVQYMNVLVRNEPAPGQSRVVLIDFEFAMDNYRAFDIGGHFMQKMFKWFDEENKIADCREYTEEEKRHFCEEYVKRWNDVTGDEDTAEQVFEEAEYGYLLAIAFDVHNMLCYMDVVEDKDPLNLLGLNKLFDLFESQYTKLGMEAPNLC